MITMKLGLKKTQRIQFGQFLGPLLHPRRAQRPVGASVGGNARPRAHTFRQVPKAFGANGESGFELSGSCDIDVPRDAEGAVGPDPELLPHHQREVGAGHHVGAVPYGPMVPAGPPLRIGVRTKPMWSVWPGMT